MDRFNLTVLKDKDGRVVWERLGKSTGEMSMLRQSGSHVTAAMEVHNAPFLAANSKPHNDGPVSKTNLGVRNALLLGRFGTYICR